MVEFDPVNLFITPPSLHLHTIFVLCQHGSRLIHILPDRLNWILTVGVVPTGYLFAIVKTFQDCLAISVNMNVEE